MPENNSADLKYVKNPYKFILSFLSLSYWLKIVKDRWYIVIPYSYLIDACMHHMIYMKSTPRQLFLPAYWTLSHVINVDWTWSLRPYVFEQMIRPVFVFLCTILSAAECRRSYATIYGCWHAHFLHKKPECVAIIKYRPKCVSQTICLSN